MRTIIITCLLLTVRTISFCQVTEIKVRETPIGVVKRAFTEMVWLNKMVVDGDTSYALRYRNSEYTEIVDVESVSFKGDNTLIGLHKILGAALNKEAGSETHFTMGEYMVMAKTGKSLGKKWILVYPGGGKGYFGLSAKEFSKLFAGIN